MEKLRLAKASRMARMNPNYEAMDAGPAEQWEEAFYNFEDYAQKKNFPPRVNLLKLLAKSEEFLSS